MLNTRGKIKKNPQRPSMEDSDQQSTNSGAMIASSDDLLTEILLRLLAVSVVRFKFVSKHWRWLLSHSHFTLRYDKLPKTPGLFAGNVYVPFDVENRSPPPLRTLDFYPDPYGIRIVQSYNGLFLCRSEGHEILHRRYYVLNPTTKQFAIIPPLPGGVEVRKSVCSMGLAFHPKHCVSYKVVCVRKIDSRGELFRIHIYSSDTRKWKISVESFSAYYPPPNGGFYSNGAIHWSPSLRSHLCFKVEAEQVQEFPLPVQVAPPENRYSYKELPIYFGESGGHLHLVTRHPSMNDLLLNVYELLSDYSGWFVKCRVDLDELADAFPQMTVEARYPKSKCFKFYLIDLVRGEKEEDTFIAVKTPDKMIRYNVNDKSFKNIFTFTSDTCRYLRGFRYTEILSSF